MVASSWRASGAVPIRLTRQGDSAPRAGVSASWAASWLSPKPRAFGSEAHVQAEEGRGPLLSEFRYGTWSRSFRFPVAIEREQLQAVYRDGLLTVTAPKLNTVSTVNVELEG